MSSMRVRVFDHGGGSLADLRAFCRRTWALNRYTQAWLEVPKSDPKATKKNLEFGNLVLVENDDTGPWGGVLWPPEDGSPGRIWTEDHILCNVFSAEYLLQLRRGPVDTPLLDTAGLVFTQLLQLAAAGAFFPVQAGEIFTGGPVAPQIIRDEPLYNVVLRTAAMAGHDWGFEPEVDSTTGRLFFRAKWFQRRGLYRNLALREGANILKPQGTGTSSDETGLDANLMRALTQRKRNSENNALADLRKFIGMSPSDLKRNKSLKGLEMFRLKALDALARLLARRRVDDPDGSRAIMLETGPLSNDVRAFSGTGLWSTRIAAAPRVDAASVGKYGLAQSYVAVQGNTQAAVDTYADSELARRKQPRRLFYPTALNVGATFQNLGLGDTLPLELIRYGFGANGGFGTSTRVRVLSKSYDERDGIMPLVVEEAA